MPSAPAAFLARYHIGSLVCRTIVKTSFLWKGRSSGEVPSNGYRAVTCTPTAQRSLGGAIDAVFVAGAAAEVDAAVVKAAPGTAVGAATTLGPVEIAEAALIVETSKGSRRHGRERERSESAFCFLFFSRAST